ncbi:uncharacterized protein LOC115924750 [Strongylocentrotus purpuratus]|uniref:Sushi domain-containing protein n=1 Tax=Strongylocentrotus purpuratus TaxID=7668 RepID=A0A7M7NYJ8_STRPU|nr:uncharacterized protein LOC115924750 [Strongylocentrotus purpuratus]
MKTVASTGTEGATGTSFLQSIFTTSSDTKTNLITEQSTNPSEITNTLSSIRMEVLTGKSTEQSTIKTSSGNPTNLMTEQSTHPTAITESLSTGTKFLTDTSTLHSTPFSASTDHVTDATTQQPPFLTDTTSTSKITEISSPGNTQMETDSTQTPPSYTDPGTEESKTTAETGKTESSTTMEIVTWTTKGQSTASHTEHATTTTNMLTTQRQTEPRETTVKSTTIPAGCILPADLDPDIYPSVEKDRYDVSDFILLYCPPPPYVHHGEVFSQCTEAGWSPDISGNACYAPCSSAAVPSYLTHSDESSGENKNQYDHGTTIAFTCTTSWKVLSASPSPMCVDGVWDGLDYPTCEGFR